MVMVSLGRGEGDGEGLRICGLLLLRYGHSESDIDYRDVRRVTSVLGREIGGAYLMPGAVPKLDV